MGGSDERRFRFVLPLFEGDAERRRFETTGELGRDMHVGGDNGKVNEAPAESWVTE